MSYLKPVPPPSTSNNYGQKYTSPPPSSYNNYGQKYSTSNLSPYIRPSSFLIQQQPPAYYYNNRNDTTSSNSMPALLTYEKIDPTVRQSQKREKERLKLQDKHRRFREDRSNANLRNEANGNPGDVDFQRLISRWRQKNCVKINPSDYNKLLEQQMKQNTNIFTVFVRKRPINQREKRIKDHDVVSVPQKGKIVIHSPKVLLDGFNKVLANQTFLLDGVFNEYASNDLIFTHICKPLLDKVYFKHENACCFAFGQTGSGKTYTIKGIEDRLIKTLFTLIDKDKCRDDNNNNNNVVQTKKIIVSYYELYGSTILDLFQNRKEVHVREDARNGLVQVRGIKKIEVNNIEDFISLINNAKKLRTTKKTKMNNQSSRSHSVLEITLENIDVDDFDNNTSPKKSPKKISNESVKASPIKKLKKNKNCQFTLVDLAGSERADDSKNHDSNLQKESGEINRSLLALKECIRAISQKKRHIPYRSSQLTLVLKNVLTKKHAHVSVVATVAPTASNHDHTVNTLKYASLLRIGKYVKKLNIFKLNNDEWDFTSSSSEGENDDDDDDDAQDRYNLSYPGRRHTKKNAKKHVKRRQKRSSPKKKMHNNNNSKGEDPMRLTLLRKKIENKKTPTKTSWDQLDAEMPPPSPSSPKVTPFSPPSKFLSRSLVQRQNSMMEKISQSPVLCIVRCRPMSKNERLNQDEEPCIEVTSKSSLNLNFMKKELHVDKFAKSRMETGHKFHFDSVLDENANQKRTYNVTAQLLIDKILAGYNVTVFAYGQTGAGKTHTMVGTPTQPGIILEMTEEILQSIDGRRRWKQGSG